MKSGILRYTTILLWTFICLTANASNYGLRLKSHDFSGRDKTSLLLLGGKPIAIGNTLTVNYKIDLRSAPIFGKILTVKGDKGQKIELIIAPDENMKTYSPNVVINDKLYPIHYTLRTFTPLRNVSVSFTFDKRKNQLIASFGGKKRVINYNMSNLKEAIFNFGLENVKAPSYDIAPVDIYDIDVRRNAKPLYFWTLRDHKDSITYDRISKAPAVASDAIWLVDSHSHWQKPFSYHTDSELQYIFNQKKNTLYVFDDDSLIIWNLATDQRQARAISGGNRVMRYSKYLYFNEKEQKIYNFNLQRKILTSFNMENCKWENEEYVKDEPAYLNNTAASHGGDDFYVFGGYGFYRFNNKLFHINTLTGKIDELNYSPKISPRTSASSTIVGNKLYIFGGIGNPSGRQELNSETYTDLWVIDLKTLKARQLWKTNHPLAPKMLYSSQMIFNPKEKCFYVATSQKKIMRLGLEKPDLKFISDTIPAQMDFDILNYSLYESKPLGKLLVVLDKYKNDKGHLLEAFTIDLPILPATEEEASNNKSWYLLGIGIIVLIIIGAGIVVVVRRRKRKNAESVEMTGSEAAPVLEAKKEDAPKQKAETTQSNPAPQKKLYYDKKVAEIRMLGEFLVYDKQGEDITSKFTPRTRNLMMMLFLHSATKSKGIEIKQLDEILWPNMSEEAARNNRNVYMRRLRVLLEEVGEVEITNDKINYKVTVGKDVFFDFGEANKLITAINEGEESKEILDRTLELLLRGPLLPNLSTEWLDGLKANYSNRALTFLHHLARRCVNEGDYDKAYSIAGAIMVHDPFSEEALALQCQILCMRKTVSIAKILYDKFCKTYEQAMGEPYAKSFADVCKGNE